MSASTASGSGAEISVTKSMSDVWPSLVCWSSMSRAIFSMPASKRRIVRGVKCGAASLRYAPWSGASITRRWRATRSSSSGGPNSGKTASRGAFRNRRGWREILMMSSCFVIAQNGTFTSRS
jgi:hypothetical protein